MATRPICDSTDNYLRDLSGLLIRLMLSINFAWRARRTHPYSSACPAAPEFIDASTCANESGFCHAKRAGAHANKSGSLSAGNKARVICGAKRRRDGQPCQGLSVPRQVALQMARRGFYRP